MLTVSTKLSTGNPHSQQTANTVDGDEKASRLMKSQIWCGSSTSACVPHITLEHKKKKKKIGVDQFLASLISHSNTCIWFEPVVKILMSKQSLR